MKTNTDFKNDALDALRGNWGKAVLATLLYFLLTCVIIGPMEYTSIKMSNYAEEQLNGYGNSITQAATLMQDPEYQALQKESFATSGLMLLLEIFILFPVMVGFYNAFRKLLVNQDTALTRNTFDFSNYFHKVLGMLQMYILTALWTLLLIIPGIIKAFAYAMTPYILDEQPELSTTEAIHRSRLMMKGHKFDLFWLILSFIGWSILAVFTLGIGFLWLCPYVQTAMASFYEEVKAEYAVNGGLD